MTRFLNGPGIWLFVAAGCGLSAYVLVTGAQTAPSTLTERGQTERSPSSSGADGARSFPRSVNVAYHRSYPVDWRRRYHGEHAHVQRLLRQLERARHVQAVHEIDWRARQIAAAETIGHEAGADPWPNCPDPIWDGAASWDVTVACENSGDWLDSPGYYRCGLQFDPMWERRFGALCP